MERSPEITRTLIKGKKEHKMPEWLTLDHFPDDTRVNLSLKGRKFIFQNNIRLKNLLTIVSPAQLSRYRSDPEMTIPLSTIRILVEDPKELFITSFTVTSAGNKKTQLPIKLPIRTQNNSLTKLLALLCLSKNVFSTGTYQTDQYEKVKAFTETFYEIFDVVLVETQNQRGYYVKIPVQLSMAIVKVFTGEYTANNPQIIRSLLNCKDEQDILEFVQTWLCFSRLYRFNEDHDCLFMFRSNDETVELVKLLDKIGISYETGSIFYNDKFVPVYRIKNTPENNFIIKSPTVVERLKTRIKHQNAKIKELETIKESLEIQLHATKENMTQKLTWSRAIDERLVEQLAVKLAEFERILVETRRENERLRQLLLNRTTNDTEKINISTSDGLEKLQQEVKLLKESLSRMNTQILNREQEHAHEQEVSLKVTKELSMRMSTAARMSDSINFQIKSQNLLRTLLSFEDNWILLIFAATKALTLDDIRMILKIPIDKSVYLRKKINTFINSGVLKTDINPEGEEIFYLNETHGSDIITEYKNILKDKERVPLEVRQVVRNLLR